MCEPGVPTADPTAITRAETRGALPLWFGVLAGPLAWSVQLAADYMAEDVVACTPAARPAGVILGIGIRTWMLAVNATTAAVTLAALVVAVHCFGASISGTPRAPGIRHRAGPAVAWEPGGERARWMALAGILNSGLFLLLIVVGFVPPLLLSTCELPR